MNQTATAHRARELLENVLGADASFRPGQLEAILAIVDDRRRVLVVQRTGWGKSLVYFLATRLRRDAGAGPTILISPLLSLIRDQLGAADRAGVSAATYNSGNHDEWRDIDERLSADELDLVAISPEHLGNPHFRAALEQMPRGIGLFVVDEAHCISDWGHDFRPDYRRIGRIVGTLPRGVPLLGTTATANDRVVADIAAQLGDDLSVVRGPLGRASLRLQTVDLPSQAERLAWMADVLPSLPGSGIVYCLTTRDCETVGRWLRSRGLRVAHYHSKMSPEERPALEEALRRNEVKALVATVALGMGFDKPDVGFVVHFQKPGSAIAYYQQIGRAGRSLSDAVVVLLHGAEDDAILDYFIDGAFPPEQALREVLGALESSEDGLTVGAIERPVNLPRGRIEQCLKVLEADGAVFKDGPRYERTANPWTLDRTRTEGVTDQRRRERQRMTDFTGGRTCLMEFLQGELDDPSASPCGRCAVCAGSIVAQHPAPAVVAAAADFLHGAHQRVLDPRKQWPAGIVGVGARAIPPALRAEAGHVLSVYRDAGWGRLVHDGKHRDHRFDDGLVEAAALAVLDSWAPDPPPQWVTAVPSISSPVVPEFARRLAVRLGLPFRAALTKVKEAPPQKTMENSYRQARNAIDAFRADGSQVSDAPVLLVDDLVDSRWTLAACAAALREAGSGPVHPLALADSSRGAS